VKSIANNREVTLDLFKGVSMSGVTDKNHVKKKTERSGTVAKHGNKNKLQSLPSQTSDIIS
jgi:hypothetical protein